MQADTAEARYNRMATDRSAYERDGEKAADLTIPCCVSIHFLIFLCENVLSSGNAKTDG